MAPLFRNVCDDHLTILFNFRCSAVAAKYLANPNSSKLCILGSGAQARSHFEALSTLFKFTDVRVWNHNIAKAEALARSLGDHVAAFGNAEEAVKDADIIVTVTSSKGNLGSHLLVFVIV